MKFILGPTSFCIMAFSGICPVVALLGHTVFQIKKKKKKRGFSVGLVIKTFSSDTVALSLIPGQGAQIPYVWWPKKPKRKKKQYYNK